MSTMHEPTQHDLQEDVKLKEKLAPAIAVLEKAQHDIKKIDEDAEVLRDEADKAMIEAQPNARERSREPYWNPVYAKMDEKAAIIDNLKDQVEPLLNDVPVRIRNKISKELENMNLLLKISTERKEGYERETAIRFFLFSHSDSGGRRDWLAEFIDKLKNHPLEI